MSSSAKTRCCNFLMPILANINRRKILKQEDIMATPLKRCINLFDLILLGIGHMVGAGIFVVTGTVVKHIAGPSTFISFLLAGFAAILSSLCFAEFGARVPKAGSSYVYTYVAIGELMAFLVGWNQILEAIIGGASVAKAWSGSLDLICNGAISNFTMEYIGHFNSSLLGPYPDFIAFFIIIFWLIFVAFDTKITTIFNNLFTIVNVIILSLFMCVGFYNADINNWSSNGGFFPFGFSGTVAGAGICFYAFCGFDSITFAGEEAKYPDKQVPIALGVSVIIVTILYVGASMAITLFIPYWQIDILAPFPAALNYHEYRIIGFIVGIGSLIGISSALIGGLYMLPRSVYAMSSDGLFFKCFARVHPTTQTPLLATVVFGLITAILGFFFNLELLVDLLSIGTLLSFTIVAVCVLILRYETVDQCRFQLRPDMSKTSLIENTKDEVGQDVESSDSLKSSQSHEDIGRIKKSFSNYKLLNLVPMGKTGLTGSMLVIFFSIGMWILIMEGAQEIRMGSWWVILLLVLSCLGLLMSVCLFCIHESNTSFLTFQIPWMPIIPVLSIVINIGLMLNLNKYTWIRLLIWIFIGLVIYFTYGINNVPESQKLLNREESCISYSDLQDSERNKKVIDSSDKKTINYGL